MDPKRYDAISHRLAAIGDRRRMLGALGALAGMAAVAAPGTEAKSRRCVPVERGCKTTNKAKPSKRCKNCCSGYFTRQKKSNGRCVCVPDGLKPKGGNAVYCCSGYINTATGACQSTCAPTCEKCCPPPTGSTIPHCGTASQICCPSSLGGGACPTGSVCCNVTADCPSFSTCVGGCCQPNS